MDTSRPRTSAVEDALLRPVINTVDALLADEQQGLLNTILSAKEHLMVSRCARP